jgi:hypothetical protein
VLKVISEINFSYHVSVKKRLIAVCWKVSIRTKFLSKAHKTTGHSNIKYSYEHTLVEKMMFSALKNTALHGVKWHKFSTATTF